MDNKRIFSSIDYLKSQKVEFCLGNNTLLSIYRDNKPFEAELREFVAFVPIRYRNKLLNLPIEHYFNLPSVTGQCNLCLQHEARMALIFYKVVGGHVSMNISEDGFQVYTLDTIEPYRQIKYLNRLIPIPHYPEKLLSEYYGDWMVKRDQWSWAKAPNIIRAKTFSEAVSKYRRKHEAN